MTKGTIPPKQRLIMTLGRRYLQTYPNKPSQWVRLIRVSPKGFNLLVEEMDCVLCKTAFQACGYANVDLPANQRTFILNVPAWVNLENDQGRPLNEWYGSKQEIKDRNVKWAKQKPLWGSAVRVRRYRQ